MADVPTLHAEFKTSAHWGAFARTDANRDQRQATWNATASAVEECDR